MLEAPRLLLPRSARSVVAPGTTSESIPVSRHPLRETSRLPIRSAPPPDLLPTLPPLARLLTPHHAPIAHTGSGAVARQIAALSAHLLSATGLAIGSESPRVVPPNRLRWNDLDRCAAAMLRNCAATIAAPPPPAGRVTPGAANVARLPPPMSPRLPPPAMDRWTVPYIPAVPATNVRVGGLKLLWR